MSEAPTRDKIDLEDGRWVRVRRLQVGDIRSAKLEAHARGFQDADLDAIHLLPALIVETSEGPVTQGFVDSISEEDYGKVWAKAKGLDSPNSSAPSSTGTRRAKVRNQTNG